ncbi:hypothetical protein HID58_052987 [Brassica napus]|uniref:Uncharacterized protein n=1 Tax=Brassica napus TaxID=3708 RepID=A0ABQ8AE88_BRANA|nr:hypothetical protein HID58_052987 [Brassica napus]
MCYNSERYILVRSSHVDDFGNDGCIKVSFDTVIFGLETGHYPDSYYYKRFSQHYPSSFNFIYLRLLRKDGENDVKRRKLSEIK